MRKVLKPEEILDFVKNKYGDKIISSEIRTKKQGISEKESFYIWITVTPDTFRPLVEVLHNEIGYLHISVISPSDMGDVIDVEYHFTLFYGIPGKEVVINIKVSLPKDKLIIHTLIDMLPGIEFSERDMHDMMGIEITGLPDEGALFLPDEFPKDFYPWRKDDKSIDNFIIMNNEGEKNGNL